MQSGFTGVNAFYGACIYQIKIIRELTPLFTGMYLFKYLYTYAVINLIARQTHHVATHPTRENYWAWYLKLYAFIHFFLPSDFWIEST